MGGGAVPGMVQGETRGLQRSVPVCLPLEGGCGAPKTSAGRLGSAPRHWLVISDLTCPQADRRAKARTNLAAVSLVPTSSTNKALSMRPPLRRAIGVGR